VKSGFSRDEPAPTRRRHGRRGRLMRSPPDTRRRVAPSETPGANSQHSVDETSAHITSDHLGSEFDLLPRDSGGGFALGQTVRVNDGVRPRRDAGPTGTVVDVARVVPEGIVRELYRQGKTTNNGDVEIGVRFGRQTSHTTAIWFQPRELTITQVGQRRPGASGKPVRIPVDGEGAQ